MTSSSVLLRAYATCSTRTPRAGAEEQVMVKIEIPESKGPPLLGALLVNGLGVSLHPCCCRVVVVTVAMVITHQLGRAHVDYLFPTTPSNLEVPCRFPFVAPLFDCSKPMRDQYTPNLPWPPLIRTSTSLVGLDIHRTLYHILWASLKQLNVKATCFSFDCCGHPPSPEPWGAYGLSYNPCGCI